MEHSRVFVHTSGPNQTWSCHRHSCLFVETVWRFFWVLFHWGKKMNVIDQTRVIRRHELSQRASSHPWGVGRNVAHLPESPPTPPVTTPRIVNPNLRSSVFEECFTAKETWPQLQRGSETLRRRKLLGKRPPRQSSGRQEGPFLLGTVFERLIMYFY